ncbi:MAG: hypothetical protein ACQCXQ_14280 [Verrucomicrobiales bacterium]|nr:hypothetical protein [Verrucomicrobiota bacterium JB025]
MTNIRSIMCAFVAAGVSCLSAHAAPGLVGEWVTSYGRYLESTTYHADGTFVRVTEIGRGAAGSDEPAVEETGSWTLAGDELARTWNDRTVTSKVRFVSATSFEEESRLGDGGVLVHDKVEPADVPVKQAAAMVHEPKPGSAERKAIMDSMRVPVSKVAGTDVLFTGSVAVFEDWAKFDGSVAAKNGQPFAEDVADELELDFLAILRKVDGKWQTLYYGWSGDIGTRIEAREKHPAIPEVLLPEL